MVDVIEKRRSIRKYLNKDISKKDLEEIIKSGTMAPSSKNRQPWQFTVVQGNAKKEMLNIFSKGIEREEKAIALLPKSKKHLAAAKYTIKILKQTPVVVFIINPYGQGIFKELTPEERVYEICNIQSLSAAIQNMLLTATEKGIGSLWVCDIFFAYEELSNWLNADGELIAAVGLGYPDENPKARPRKSIDDLIQWRK